MPFPARPQADGGFAVPFFGLESRRSFVSGPGASRLAISRLVISRVLLLACLLALLWAPGPAVAHPHPSETPLPASMPRMIHPLPGEVITSRFGERIDPVHGRRSRHSGIDIDSRPGSRVLAPADGRVVLATRHWNQRRQLGTVVVLDHGDGVRTIFGHLESIAVREGETVRRGQVLAVPGSTGKSTGSHLHFEVRHRGRAIDPARVIHELR